MSKVAEAQLTQFVSAGTLVLYDDVDDVKAAITECIRLDMRSLCQRKGLCIRSHVHRLSCLAQKRSRSSGDRWHREALTLLWLCHIAAVVYPIAGRAGTEFGFCFDAVNVVFEVAEDVAEVTRVEHCGPGGYRKDGPGK